MDDGNALYAALTHLAAWLGVPVFLPTMSRAELIYGTPIVLAWALGVWMLLDVERDLIRLRRSGRNGQLLVMKTAAIRRERLQVAGLTGWMIAVVPLLFDSKIRLVTFVLGALVYAWCKAANAVLERRYRMRQERYYERMSALAALAPTAPVQAPHAPVAESAPTTLPTEAP